MSPIHTLELVLFTGPAIAAVVMWLGWRRSAIDAAKACRDNDALIRRLHETLNGDFA